ncbi:hypothetical protein JG688_00007745 [Phytophthora aleatoria]|uniref:Tyr recombinase domain-containing protein n=1 Tax=Phytophthora aleatoria TaxID=2496075 RepID=A0A8J5IRZ4_9STRA|nr:hypothetical protein JG688_00007745 [Phytophthora aleatoria]
MLNRSGHHFTSPRFGLEHYASSRHTMACHRQFRQAVFINKRGKPDCTSSRMPTNSIRQAAAILGSSPTEFSVHSLRVGEAMYMYRAGVDTLTIQFQGGEHTTLQAIRKTVRSFRGL